LNLKSGRERAEKEYIHKALLRHNGNISRTADELGISRPTLYDLLRKYRLEDFEQ